jgi:isochorismate synthase EntC
MLFVIVGFIQNRFMDGATPERLLKAENKKFSTMIAGTQKSLG